jgi:hypothetical protein
MGRLFPTCICNDLKVNENVVNLFELANPFMCGFRRRLVRLFRGPIRSFKGMSTTVGPEASAGKAERGTMANENQL